MGFSVAVQGVLQALLYSFRPFLTALLRLVVFVFPIAYLFTLSPDVTSVVWWTFPISEFLTAVVSFFILIDVLKKRLTCLNRIKMKNKKMSLHADKRHIGSLFTYFYSFSVCEPVGLVML